MSHAILLISSPDQRGITASVTEFIFKNNGNIVHADQHIDEQSNTFFMRIEWTLDDFSIKREKIDEKFKPIANKFQMTWNLSFTDERPRIAIFVSRHLHCLQDLIYRQQAEQLACDIPLIISNHPELERVARQHGIPYHIFPITRENKKEQEQKQLALLAEHNIHFIVLARYMQILTEDFIDRYSMRIINIHHSFLPAFPGAKPYHEAHQRGVKIIGATSHYVSAKLDAGPIIEQDIARVSHRDAVKDLIRKGRDLEKVVLARAIWNHQRRNILIYNNKTVIFD